MSSDDLVFGALIIVVGGLFLYAACAVGWGFSKEIQPHIDDLFDNYPKKRKPENSETRSKLE